MARPSQLTAVLAVVISISSSSIVTSPDKKDGTFELLILHNNDMHARFEQTSQLSGACTVIDRDAGRCYGGFPRVAYVVKEARRAAASGQGPPVLYLNAGDTYTGTAWFTIYKWKIAAEFLNALQPDAVSLGNHEFDEAVGGVIPFIRNLTAPVLAANLILDDVPELKQEKNLYRSIILYKNGVKIGIIGYLTPETKFLAPKTKVNYEDEIPAVRREVSKLKENGVNIIIALGHSGFIKDLEIASEVDDIDIVIGGHSNTFLSNENTTEIPEFPQGPYPTIVMQKSGKKVLVVQAYAYTKYMGSLFLTFNDNGDIIEYEGKPVLLNIEVPQDPDVLQIVNKYHSDIDRINSVVVGTSLTFLDGDSCRLHECNLGDFISDSMLYYTKRYYTEFSQVNIAFIQGGRIRTSLDQPQKPFNLTRGDWITVMPFSDTLCIVNMNGSVLMKALEHSVDSWRKIDSTGQFLQMSGVEVIYDLSKIPGSRVIKAGAICSGCEKLEDIENNLQYKIIMSEFLANGGDGYFMFEGLEKEFVSYNEVVCALDYLSRFSPINPQVSRRVTLLNEDKMHNILDNMEVNIGATNRLLPSSACTSHINLVPILTIITGFVFIVN